MGKYKSTIDTSPLQSKQNVFGGPRVGSIKMKETNFPSKESFFFPDEWVPKHVREISKQVKQDVNPDTLGMRKP